METDYLIIGQGIAGTLISYELLKANKTVVVVDQPLQAQASRIAGGIINPFVLRGRSNGEMLRKHSSIALEVYRDLENILGISLIQEKKLIFFHGNESDAVDFRKRLHEKNEFNPGKTAADESLTGTLFHEGMLWDILSPVWQLNLNALLNEWRQKLQSSGSLLEEYFDYKKCQFRHSRWFYRNINAGNLIFCEGTRINLNPFIQNPVLIPNCGDVLMISIPALDPKFIYERNCRLLHWSEDIFWCGTTHRWNYVGLTPDIVWRENVEQDLKDWLIPGFRIVDHRVAERPAIAGQRIITGPVAGHPAAYIFNGLGTRGVINGPAAARTLNDLLKNQSS